MPRAVPRIDLSLCRNQLQFPSEPQNKNKNNNKKNKIGINKGPWTKRKVVIPRSRESLYKNQMITEMPWDVAYPEMP